MGRPRVVVGRGERGWGGKEDSIRRIAVSRDKSKAGLSVRLVDRSSIVTTIDFLIIRVTATRRIRVCYLFIISLAYSARRE